MHAYWYTSMLHVLYYGISCTFCWIERGRCGFVDQCVRAAPNLGLLKARSTPLLLRCGRAKVGEKWGKVRESGVRWGKSGGKWGAVGEKCCRKYAKSTANQGKPWQIHEHLGKSLKILARNCWIHTGDSMEFNGF